MHSMAFKSIFIYLPNAMYCELTTIFLCSLIFTVGKHRVYGNDNIGLDYTEEENNENFLKPESKWPEPECWMNLKVKQLFESLNTLEEKYDDVRQDYQTAVEKNHLNDKLLSAMLLNKGFAQKTSGALGQQMTVLPAGINLGGYSTMTLNDSIVFFHLMKLRDNTFIRVNYLHNDIYNMILTARIGLDDLLLTGSYERAIIDQDPFSLVYKPTIGHMELLLSGVNYKVEARYRLGHRHLHVEHITSHISVGEMFITFYKNGEPGPAQQLNEFMTEEYLERMKVDMDVFIKDYLNNYLMLFDLSVYSNDTAELQNYDQEKALILDEWVDEAVRQIRSKMHRLKVTSVKQPSYSIYSPDGMIFKLKGGVLRGLDSIHRRSVATCKLKSGVRTVDAILGFSTLQLEYKYEAMMHIGDWPLTGMLVLNADDLSAHMSISMIQEPETIDLYFRFYKQARTEFLVIAGDINKKIDVFKHLLQNHVLSLITTSVLNTVAGLKYLTKCRSSGVLISHIDKGEIHLRDENDDQNKITSNSSDAKDNPANNKDGSSSKIIFKVPNKDTMYRIAINEKRTTTLSGQERKNSTNVDVKGSMVYEALKSIPIKKN